ncbi:copper resistance protein B [Sphingomonas carotinifaciens]|uniref:copper resistance protein B n=1 Tax=Sphingomonas carotinifaciens TaxID=1166323 RepID=UPI000DD6360E|nr:copper resistance protein B [Sphingomonas carotinifaciens]
MSVVLLGLLMVVPQDCSPEHAAMGHCKAAPATPAPAATETCSPEHAAMGHCKAAPAVPAPPAAPCAPEHAAMGHCTPAPVRSGGHGAMDHDAMEHGVGAQMPPVVGDALPPPVPTTRAADAFYDPVAMARAERRMRREHGGMAMHQVILNIAEVQVRNGRDGYRWDGEGWFGGDIHRLVVKSEGEGDFGRRVDAAEVQALYARAVDPYWNLQAGVRQDVGAGARRTYAVLGVEGLAPYWFDVEGALFLSDRGDVLARGEAWYDQRITQRLIAQPRVEFNLAAQDVPASRIGAGLSSAEAGLRLRYEIAREFAPYVGVSWERRYGATARYARRDGGGTGGFALALGVRAWF